MRAPGCHDILTRPVIRDAVWAGMIAHCLPEVGRSEFAKRRRLSFDYTVSSVPQFVGISTSIDFAVNHIARLQ